MKSGKPVVNPFGFTILEVMIVLAVTLVIFVSAVLAVSGRTQTAEFSDEVNELQSSFQSLMNNVATGYYNTSNTYCSVSWGSKSLDITQTPATDNGECTLLGEALLFTGPGNSYYGFPVLGSRQDITDGPNSGVLATTYKGTQPTLPPTSLTDLVTTYPLSNELVAQWVHYSTTAGGSLQSGLKTDMVAFLDDPAAVGTPPPTGNTSSGAVNVNVIPIPDNAALAPDPGASGALTTADGEANYSATSTNSLAQTADASENPAGGVGICFASQSTQQSVMYTFGGSNRNATIENQIFNGATC